MTNVQPNRTVRRGRLFPEIEWSAEKKAQWRAEREAFIKRCKPIFDRLKPELIKTHYNWYMAVEPDSGEYFIDKDDMVATKMRPRNTQMLSPTFSASTIQGRAAQYDSRNIW